MHYTIPDLYWPAVWPVLIVMGTGCLALIVEMLRPKQNNNVIVGVSLLGLGAAIVMAAIPLVDGMQRVQTFGGMVLLDEFGSVMQIVLAACCFLTFLFSEGYLRQKRIAFGEFYPLALWSVAGGMIMVSTTNLLMMFLGLEVLSISLYVLAGMSRQEGRSEESAIKYFLLGAFATAFLLLGISFIFGASGTLDISGIAYAFDHGRESMRNFAVLGVALLLIGVGFKASFFPFHMWTPDVYQGAPTNVTAFMASVSKIAAFGMLIRVLVAAIPLEIYFVPILFWTAILTMTVGNLGALVQRDVKRALGYSSIAHAGYILVAVLAYLKAPETVSLTTAVYYLIVYSAMTLGAFAIIGLLAKSGKEYTRTNDLNGMWQKSPFAAVALGIFMISLVGVPPTAGFFGKLLIFSDALSAGLVSLAIVLAVNSVISVFYYLNIAKAAFVSDENAVSHETSKMGVGLATSTVICLVVVLGVSFFTPRLIDSMRLDGADLSVSYLRPGKIEPEEILRRGEADSQIGASSADGAPIDAVPPSVEAEPEELDQDEEQSVEEATDAGDGGGQQGFDPDEPVSGEN